MVLVGKKEGRQAPMERPSGPLVLPILLGCHRTSDGAWEPWKVQKTQTMEVKLGRWVQYCDIYLYTHFLPSLHLVRLSPALNFKRRRTRQNLFSLLSLPGGNKPHDVWDAHRENKITAAKLLSGRTFTGSWRRWRSCAPSPPPPYT